MYDDDLTELYDDYPEIPAEWLETVEEHSCLAAAVHAILWSFAMVGLTAFTAALILLALLASD